MPASLTSARGENLPSQPKWSAEGLRFDQLAFLKPALVNELKSFRTWPTSWPAWADNLSSTEKQAT